MQKKVRGFDTQFKTNFEILWKKSKQNYRFNNFVISRNN